MPDDVRSYLAEIRTHLHLEPEAEARVISELDSHFQDKLADLREGGVEERLAVREAISSFGPPRDVARLMYEACSRGSWTDAIVSMQPHILVAALFGTHLWRQPPVLAFTFSAIAVMALLGWRAGRPVWTYSWAGYALFPLLAGSYLCRAVPREALAALARGAALLDVLPRLAVVAGLYGVTLSILVNFALGASRADWIRVSVAFLPLAVLGIWMYAVEQGADSPFGAEEAQPAHMFWDRTMMWLCTFLGLAAAAFVRLRARLLKGVAVVLFGTVAGVLLVRTLSGGLRLGGFLASSLGLFLLLVSPFLLHSLFGHPPAEPPQARELHAS